MKIAFLFLFSLMFSLVALGQAEDKLRRDSLHRADSIARWKADSIRISNSSPVRINNTKQNSPVLQTGPTPTDKKVKSNYILDNDGRVTGGNTSLELNKSKRKKTKQ